MDEAQLNSLAAGCRSGDEKCARPLVEALTRSLIATAWRYTHDWESARDLAQETWMKAFSKLDSYDTERSFRAWLFAVHRNGCLDHLKSAHVRREVLPGDAAIRSQLTADDDAERRLERRELRELVLRAADTLSRAQREAFLRVDVEGAEPKRVAGEMGIEHGTLRATLHVARRRLAKSLRERMNEEAS